MLRFLFGTNLVLSIARSLAFFAVPAAGLAAFSPDTFSRASWEIEAAFLNALALPQLYPLSFALGALLLVILPIGLRVRRDGYTTATVLQEAWHVTLMAVLYLIGVWVATRGIYLI